MGTLIAIRADGNKEIGFGHLIRTQALARQLVSCGAKVVFLSRDSENIKAYQAIQLNYQTGPEAEDLEVEQALKLIGADILIIDSYAYGQDRLDKMTGLKLLSVFIDDLNLYEYNVDMVINGNIYAPGLIYQGKAELLLGTQYLLMREAFANISPRVLSSAVKDILVTFGAADIENMTPRIMTILADYRLFNEISWHVVVGPVFQNADMIMEFGKDKENVHIHYNPDMNKLMKKCDLCISAAGSTAYELAACGTPAVLIVVADNQLRLAAEANSQGMAINLGWHYNISTDQIYAVLDQLITSYNLRTKMAKRGQSLVDGKGADRVANHLLTMLKKRG